MTNTSSTSKRSWKERAHPGAGEAMLISRLHSIPRFALPYTPADFAAALLAIFRGAPSPEPLRLLGDSPKFWTRSGRQALRLLLEALELKPRSGVALPLVTNPS